MPRAEILEPKAVVQDHCAAMARAIIWGLLGLALLLALVLGIWAARRQLLGDDERSTPDLLDLATLQRLRDEKSISEREYRVLRDLAIASLGAKRK
jgi:flagellar biogenesis protein FliO